MNAADILAEVARRAGEDARQQGLSHPEDIAIAMTNAIEGAEMALTVIYTSGEPYVR